MKGTAGRGSRKEEREGKRMNGIIQERGRGTGERKRKAGKRRINRNKQE